jgi:CheY-like chemotaxis protein
MVSSRARVLIVDDEPAILEVTSALLASEGYDVSTAEDGVAAMEHLVDPLPDLVISDLCMPNMSGFELTFTIHQLCSKITELISAPRTRVPGPTQVRYD